METCLALKEDSSLTLNFTSMFQAIVLYPHPADAQEFDSAYVKHLELLHEKTGIPATERPYTVTKFLQTPFGAPAFYQMFAISFPTLDALQATLMSPGMQEVNADATRISTGGAPVVLIGSTL